MARARWEKKKTNTLVHVVHMHASTHTQTCTHAGMADGTGQCICRLIKMRGGPTDRAFIRMRPKNTHARARTHTHTHPNLKSLEQEDDSCPLLQICKTDTRKPTKKKRETHSFK